MLAVPPLRGNLGLHDERDGGGAEGIPIGIDDFPEFAEGNLLDSIDFDDLFVGMEGGDVLPDLEMDPEIFAEFSGSGGEESEMNPSASVEKVGERNSSSCLGDEIVSKGAETAANPSANEGEGGRERGNKKSPSQSKNSQGKRKVKVDWTPELHRRFVQAVEQLGVDKAVPSRILELMGIDCLTRHNIASHLQKYRSHRKHLLAREAEAANWTQSRRMYGSGKSGAWAAPTNAMGFPPMAPPSMQHFRPLHVWGHPSMNQSLMHMWPKHLVPSPSAPPPQATWALPPPHPPATRPPSDPSFWHCHNQRVANSIAPVTPYFQPPIAAVRFPSPPVTCIVPPLPLPPHAMYKVDPSIGVPTRCSGPQPPFDFHPSKESIDAAIGDVISKPWSPLPLGLKPPSVDGVLLELQRQGISNIPPSCA